MSIDDLANLADALTFALLVTVGGLIAWATIRATSRRPNLRRAMKRACPAGAPGDRPRRGGHVAHGS